MPKPEKIVIEDLKELKETEKCFICKAELIFIKAPDRPATLETCSNKTCFRYIYPPNFIQVKERNQYELATKRQQATRERVAKLGAAAAAKRNKSKPSQQLRGRGRPKQTATL